MKKLFSILLFALPLTAQANLGATVSGLTISWPATGGYMQVQDVSDYSTVCEARGISSCTVPTAGTYQITDHTANIKQRNIQVIPSSNTVFPVPLQTQPIQQNDVEVKHSCMTSQYQNHSTCELSCPSGMTIKRITTCRATNISAGNLLVQSDFDSNVTTLYCRAGDITGLTEIRTGLLCEY